MNNPSIDCTSEVTSLAQVCALTPGFLRFHFPEAPPWELSSALGAWRDSQTLSGGRARRISAMAMRWPYPTAVLPSPSRGLAYIPQCFERAQADAVEAMLTPACAPAENGAAFAEVIADVAAEALVSLRFRVEPTTCSFRFLSARADAPLTWLRLAYALGRCSLNGQLDPEVASRGISTIGQTYAKWRIGRPGLEDAFWRRVTIRLSRGVSEATIADAVLLAQPNLALVPVERLWPRRVAPRGRRLSPAAVEKRVAESPEPAPLRHLSGVLVP